MQARDATARPAKASGSAPRMPGRCGAGTLGVGFRPNRRGRLIAIGTESSLHRHARQEVLDLGEDHGITDGRTARMTALVALRMSVLRKSSVAAWEGSVSWSAPESPRGGRAALCVGGTRHLWHGMRCYPGAS